MIVHGSRSAPSAVRGWIPWLLALAGYTALTVVMMWPIVAHISSALPHDAIDPALNSWILWWNAHAMPLTARWRDAPMFWPMPGSLMLSEHLVGIAWVTTPLLWAGATPLTVYNVAWLASFPLCAIAAHALVVAIVDRHDAAAIAGLVFGFSPYRTAQAAHLQVLWAFGIPLALLALHRYAAEPRRAWLGVFAVSWSMQALTSGYYLLFFPTLVVCWLLWFTTDRPRTAMVVASVWAIAWLPLLPFLWAYVATHDALNLQRTMGEIEGFSGDAIGVLIASPDSMSGRRMLNAPLPEGMLFPGALALALMVTAVAVAGWRAFRAPRDPQMTWLVRTHAALVWLFAFVTAVGLSPRVIGPWQIAGSGHVLLSVHSIEKPMSIALVLAVLSLLTSHALRRWWRERSVLAFYLLAAALTYVLSLGPHGKLAGTPVLFRAPYFWLMGAPGFSSARAPGRFGVLFIACTAIVAALVFARATQGFSRRLRGALAAAAALLIAVESWPALAIAAVAPPIHALADAGSNAPVLELPAGDPERDAAAVYRSMTHGRPVVNGYSGYVPPHYRVLLASLRAGDGDVLIELARRRSLTVAIDRRVRFEQLDMLVANCHGVLVGDDGDWAVYQVAGAEAAPAPTHGAPLSIASVTAHPYADSAHLMRDGDPATGWSTRRAQAGGEEVTVELGAERRVDAVRLLMASFVDDFPRRLIVDCAGIDSGWTPCWQGSASSLALRAVLADARSAPLTIPIGIDRVTHLRLRQVGSDPVNAWSIGELAVLGR